MVDTFMEDAKGFGVMNGSNSIALPPLTTSKQECP
jgi:hypothetical protein